MDKEVAQTILQQLGGGRFVAMTGASSFAYGDNLLTFRLKRSITRHRTWGMRITLTPADLYDLELLTMKDFEVTTVDERRGVHVEDLRATFTDMTGLHTSLGAAA